MSNGMAAAGAASVSPTSMGSDQAHKGAHIAELPLVQTAYTAVIEATTDISEVACEYQDKLSLVQLINLIDLYRALLASAAENRAHGVTAIDPELFGGDQVLSFHQFVNDRKLLAIAALAAEEECGSTVAVPEPLNRASESRPAEVACVD